MSVLLICPSNLTFMPYVSYYDKNNSQEYSYIIWDRFSTETNCNNKFIYKDGSNGHRKGLLKYLRFSIFIYSKIFELDDDDKIVIFGIQLAFFLTPFLVLTKKKYVIDVRDYHYLFKVIPFIVFEKASFISISAPAYKKLFNKKVKSVMSHNLYEYSSVNRDNNINYNKPIVISYMGAIRDFSCQIELINNLGNNSGFLIEFHGNGDIVIDLKKYVVENNIENVEFTGEYSKEDEFAFYKKASLVNMLRESNDYNNKVALPNRLYSSAYFYRPCICYEGSAIAEIIKHFSLGICLKIDDNMESSINEYFQDFSFYEFKINCDRFLKEVREDQNNFINELFLFFKKDIKL